MNEKWLMEILQLKEDEIVKYTDIRSTHSLMCVSSELIGKRRAKVWVVEQWWKNSLFHKWMMKLLCEFELLCEFVPHLPIGFKVSLRHKMSIVHNSLKPFRCHFCSNFVDAAVVINSFFFFVCDRCKNGLVIDLINEIPLHSHVPLYTDFAMKEIIFNTIFVDEWDGGYENAEYENCRVQ